MHLALLAKTQSTHSPWRIKGSVHPVKKHGGLLTSCHLSNMSWTCKDSRKNLEEDLRTIAGFSFLQGILYVFYIEPSSNCTFSLHMFSTSNLAQTVLSDLSNVKPLQPFNHIKCKRRKTLQHLVKMIKC